MKSCSTRWMRSSSAAVGTCGVGAVAEVLDGGVVDGALVGLGPAVGEHVDEVLGVLASDLGQLGVDLDEHRVGLGFGGERLGAGADDADVVGLS